MADKIVGPLTLKQLIMCAIGGAITYFVYMSTSQMYVLTVWGPATAIPAILTVAVAFVKINDIPFLKFAFLQLERALRPTKRSFQKGSAEARKSILSTQTTTQSKKTAKKIHKKEEIVQEKMKDIDSLTKILDSQSNPQ